MKRAALVAGILAVAALALSAGFRHSYADRLIRRMAAAPVPPAEAGVPLESSARPVVLLLGDSRALEWGEPPLGGGLTANRGSFGALANEVRAAAAVAVNAVRPDAVVIEAGINDLKLLGLRPSLRAAVTDECEANLVATVALCRAAGARVILLSVWPTGPVSLERRLLWGPAIDVAVEEVNRRLEQRLAGQDGVVFLRLLPERAPPSLFRDTLHLTAASYAALTPPLAAAVKALLAAP